MSTTPDFTTYTRDHWSCLLYVETRVVDAGGKLERERMNEADVTALEDFEACGLLDWGGTGMHPVITFTDRGWAVAHAIRRARAEKAPRESWPDLASRATATFEEAWAAKEAEGYQYGPDALEGVRFGWDLARGKASSKVVIAGL